METLPDELFPLIIASDWQVYYGLLGYPKFARLAQKDPAKWRKMVTIEICTIDSTKWYLAGRLHRDGDLPAVINSGGGQLWYQHGKFHRDGGLPALVYPDGSQWWYQHGNCHRDGDLPAIIWIGICQRWYQHGKLHRDGVLPAVIHADGDQEWWTDGNRLQ